MPLLTVRLTDEDYAALKSLAGGSSMAELVRAWIAGSSIAGQPREMELEAEVKRLKRELAGRPTSAQLMEAASRRGPHPEVVHVAAPARRGDAAHLAFRPAPKPGAKKR